MNMCICMCVYCRVRIKQPYVQNQCFEINTFLVFKELYFFVKYPPPHKPLVRFLDIRLFDSLLSVFSFILKIA